MTGVLHFVNQTPVDWYSKRQSTVATATFGSEFVTAKICTEQVLELRTMLRYLGVPVHHKSYVFGDNKSVITQSTLLHSQLAKRQYALAYHRVREAVAAGIIDTHHIAGKANPADILTKFLGYQEFWPLVKPILFWRRDTAATLQTKGSDSDLAQANPLAVARVLSVAKKSHQRSQQVVVTRVTNGRVHTTKHTPIQRRTMTASPRAHMMETDQSKHVGKQDSIKSQPTVRTVKNLQGFTKIHSRLKMGKTDPKTVDVNHGLSRDGNKNRHTKTHGG